MKVLSTAEFIHKAQLKHGEKYRYDHVKYQRSCIAVTITCPTHGNWNQRPNDHLRGCGCPNCKIEKNAACKRSTKSEFMQRAQTIHGSTYIYDKVKYINAITKVEIVCTKHGSFFQTPDKHLGGTACPKCSQCVSRGERAIQKWLETHNITYEFNKTFPGLHGKTKNAALRYDFWLPEHTLLIEFDGEHHFRPTRTKGRLTQDEAIRKHRTTVINDRKKKRYATKHNLKLIRLSDIKHINSALRGILNDGDYLS